MSNPWTPGPWRVDPNMPQDVQTGDGAIEVTTTWRKGMMTAAVGAVFPERDEAFANARLIAAAPEMAELLEALTYNAEMDGHMHDPTVAATRALLARIRGDAP